MDESRQIYCGVNLDNLKDDIKKDLELRFVDTHGIDNLTYDELVIFCNTPSLQWKKVWLEIKASKMYNLNSKEWSKLPISEHDKPKNGYICYCDRYWIVTEDSCILKFNKSSYQCNAYKTVSDNHVKNFPNCTSVFFDVLYLPQNDHYENY